jgi:cytidylate kinase
MNQADVVRRYLHEPRDVDFRDTGFPLITISREAGTNAHGIGRYILMRLAEYSDPDLNTGWDLFDQKLCALIAQNKSLDADYDTLMNDKYRTEGLQRMIYEMLIGTSQQYKIQKKIEEVIHLLARLGKVVVIGRGGFQIARHLPGAIHLRLVAPMEYRVETVMKYDHLSEEEAVKKIKNTDAERAGFLKSHHNCDIHDPTLFDIVWNVARIRTPEMVNTMAELIRLRLQHLRETGAIRTR